MSCVKKDIADDQLRVSANVYGASIYLNAATRHEDTPGTITLDRSYAENELKRYKEGYNELFVDRVPGNTAIYYTWK